MARINADQAAFFPAFSIFLFKIQRANSQMNAKGAVRFSRLFAVKKLRPSGSYAELRS